MISRNKAKGKDVLKKFKEGDWVFGLGKNKGCSPVFIGTYGDVQPFSFLDDYDPNNFRLATKDEIKKAQNAL